MIFPRLAPSLLMTFIPCVISFIATAEGATASDGRARGPRPLERPRRGREPVRPALLAAAPVR